MTIIIIQGPLGVSCSNAFYLQLVPNKLQLSYYWESELPTILPQEWDVTSCLQNDGVFLDVIRTPPSA